MAQNVLPEEYGVLVVIAGKCSTGEHGLFPLVHGHGGTFPTGLTGGGVLQLRITVVNPAGESVQRGAINVPVV